MKQTLIILFCVVQILFHFSNAGAEPVPLQETTAKLEVELVAKLGEQQRARITKGIRQAASFWRSEDGDAAAFEAVVRKHFLGDKKTLEETFQRFEYTLEQLDGHLHNINLEFNRQSHLDLGEIQPIDEILAAYNPWAHINDDFFENKLAFIALLNFPLTTLDERIQQGESWSRKQWAEARLAQRFSKRIPAEVNTEVSKAGADAERYISEYNIWMHHLLDENGKRLFPPKMRLLSHWNLRDELKAAYADPASLGKQRMIQTVMERIVTQTIPQVVIDNPHVDWNPVSNRVSAAAVNDAGTSPAADQRISNAPEPNTRYEKLLNNFKAMRKVDPYSPTAPTLMARSFEEDREISESRVKSIFEQILSSPLVSETAAIIQSRLGRKLEPFDIWYSGFRPRSKYTEAELDQIVAKKYPNAEGYAADIPRMLQQLGFAKERSISLASNIVVEPARGSGHAWGAERRGDKANLRTRIEKGGMNYKGYNIAVHEMGHNIEQLISLNEIDHTLLHGVPNTAFTEALAFVFQGHDLELLGLSQPDPSEQAIKTLNDFWSAYEIAGVGLVDMGVWNWMYQHPEATPEQVRDGVLQISKDIWNRYYAPVFQKRDVVLLGIYSHMIERFLYLPDYPIGRLIAFQVEEKMNQAGKIGPEFERIARIGRISPDLWMKKATGAPVGADAILRATEKAVRALRVPR